MIGVGCTYWSGGETEGHIRHQIMAMITAVAVGAARRAIDELREIEKAGLRLSEHDARKRRKPSAIISAVRIVA